MGAPQGAVGVFLVVAWLVTLALPSGWHSVHGHGLKNYDVGLYKYEVSTGSAGQVVSALSGTIGKVGKVDVDKAVDGVLGDGTYWMNQAEEDQCLPFVDVVAFPGSREWCDMWRRMKTASYIAVVSIAIGALLAGVSAGLSFNTLKQSESVSKFRKVAGSAGPAIGLLGMAVYFFMTMDFPDPVDSQKELTLGGAYWAALVFGLLLVGVSVWTTCADKEPTASSEAGPIAALGGGQWSTAACERGEQLAGQGPPTFQADYQTFGGQGPPWAGFRPDPLPPPDLHANNPGTLSMPLYGSPSPMGSTSPLAFQAPQGTMSQPPAPWGLTAPQLRDVPGVSKSHPFDR